MPVQIAKFARSTASTFAPRGSGSAARSKNPAFKGSTLYTIFEVQAWASAVVGPRSVDSFALNWPQWLCKQLSLDRRSARC